MYSSYLKYMSCIRASELNNYDKNYHNLYYIINSNNMIQLFQCANPGSVEPANKYNSSEYE